MRKVLLISVKPEYSQKIFTGEKKIELRKVKPSIKSGDIVVIYESSPTMALKGSVIVDSVLSETPESIWNKYNHIAGISKDKYNEYYQNHNLAYGITFNKVTEYEYPLTLKTLRKLWDGFSPPQSYRYLTYDDTEKLVCL